MPQLTDLQDYYANLLILQYHSKHKAIQTIKTSASLYACDGLVFQLLNILDIDTAQGAQLDLIGKILGCSRTVQGLTIDKAFFSFSHTGAKGFSTVLQPSSGIWKTVYNSLQSVYSLQDADYRLLLKFKALKNVWRCSMKTIDDTLYQQFGNLITMTNNEDLSITYKVQPVLNVALSAAIHLGYLTAPCGIKYSYEYIEEA